MSKKGPPCSFLTLPSDCLKPEALSVTLDWPLLKAPCLWCHIDDGFQFLEGAGFEVSSGSHQHAGIMLPSLSW